MGVYRTYIDKSNTLISGSEINTSRNEIIQLYYGDGYTRHIFKFNLNEINDLYNNHVIKGTVKHVLKFKNTSNFDINPHLENYDHLQFSDKKRATSFQLELHEINEFWTEGDGYAYEKPINVNPDDKEYVEDVSNWIYASGTTEWANPGVIGSGSTAIGTVTLDRGGEDIEFDITNYVIANTVSSGSTEGLCLKFPYATEQLSIGEKQFVGFFSKETNTYFEPYIETTYDDYVEDNRHNFTIGKDNNLVFYSNVDGNFVNLDEVPTVSVNGNTGYTPTQITKGVYEVTIPASGTTGFTSHTMYKDTWTFTYNGDEYTKTFSFVPKPKADIFSFGTDLPTKPKKYAITVNGINYNEDISVGEVRRLDVLLKSMYELNNHNINEIEYKLYIKNGNSQYNITDWCKVNRGASTNYLLLDTTWLLPQTYYMDFRVKENNEVKVYNKKIKFNLVNNYNEKYNY